MEGARGRGGGDPKHLSEILRICTSIFKLVLISLNTPGRGRGKGGGIPPLDSESNQNCFKTFFLLPFFFFLSYLLFPFLPLFSISLSLLPYPFPSLAFYFISLAYTSPSGMLPRLGPRGISFRT